MIILVPKNWQDYELLDSGNGRRLERFGKYLLVRPDPQAIWQQKLPLQQWQAVDAVFDEQWKIKTKLPDKWLCSYGSIKFWVKLSPFKHTGVFPEQANHWDFITNIIARSEVTKQSNAEIATGPKVPRNDDQIHILNLFAYTGIASVVAAKAGAKVTHVDGSFPSTGWAKDNQKASGLPQDSIRWILDDCLKFVSREVKRGVKYNGIIMDPPIYGHGPKGETWDFLKDFRGLVETCTQLLTDSPLFFIVNAYAISASSIMLENVLQDFLPDGKIESGELSLEESCPGKRLLSTGIFARWVGRPE